jgi:phosphoribosylaminoimidazole carboxylase (NCAIR synthetase)
MEPLIRNDEEDQNQLKVNSSLLSIDANNVPNAVLKRLIEEVKLESQNHILAYNRSHNRHNRGR